MGSGTNHRLTCVKLQWIAPSSVALVGSMVFGIGWGLAGFCPGPALVAMGAGFPKAWGFVVAMLSGMAVFEFIERVKLSRQHV